MGTFDHLEWTYDGAFEQLFSLGRGEFEQKFSKNSNVWGVARGGGCLRGSVPKNGPIDFASKNHFSLNSADGKGLVPKY